MNLVISGPIDDTLRNLVVALSRPRRVVSLHAKADRLEGVDDGIDVKSQVAALCDAARVDHAYVEEGVRFADFKLLAMDMDSTLITIECIDEIADFAGKKKEVAAITAAAMRGELDFAESLRRRVALLEGTPVGVLQCVYNERVKLSIGANNLLGAARRSGLSTILISGGFTFFTNRLKDELKFDYAVGNVLEVFSSRLTGKVMLPIIDAHAKARFVRKTLVDLNCTREQAIVIGDGANDILMMNEVFFSVAFHAKSAVSDIARIAIKHGPLSNILDYMY